MPNDRPLNHTTGPDVVGPDEEEHVTQDAPKPPSAGGSVKVVYRGPFGEINDGKTRLVANGDPVEVSRERFQWMRQYFSAQGPAGVSHVLEEVRG